MWTKVPLFLVLFLLKFVHSNLLLDTSCFTSLDCIEFVDEDLGKNATCVQKTCVCFDKLHNNIECKPANFLQFNVIGGPCPCKIPKAHCDTVSEQCVCNQDYTFSTDRRRCIKAIVPLNNACEDDSQCLKYDNFAECNLLSKTCTCQNNYTHYDSVCQSVITLGGNCVSNEQCNNHTANSLCFERQCICAKEFVANENGTSCLSASDYAESCNDTKQCRHKLGVGSLCDSGVCVCDSRHHKVTEADGDLNCMKTIFFGDSCYEHNDCYEFGAAEQKMECYVNQCVCRKGYEDNENMECVKISGSAELAANKLFVSAVILLTVYLMSSCS